MKFQNPFLFCILLALSLFIYKKFELSKPDTYLKKDYQLIVERGALHRDRFELTPTKIIYGIKNEADQKDATYSAISEVKLDSSLAHAFFENIENGEFKNLRDRYTHKPSNESGLKITLVINQKTKSVLCNDYDSGCPDILKNIEKEVVALGGNSASKAALVHGTSKIK
ncbi:MAG: hypothetical protein ACFCUL_11965 [Flavobacteriaceae bacterium]